MSLSDPLTTKERFALLLASANNNVSQVIAIYDVETRHDDWLSLALCWYLVIIFVILGASIGIMSNGAFWFGVPIGIIAAMSIDYGIISALVADRNEMRRMLLSKQ